MQAHPSRLLLLVVHLALVGASSAYILSLVAHAWLILSYPFPLDYGEGPLLAQIEQLRAGVPFWQLYADPALPPYLIVNYPPVYPVLTAALSLLTGNALLAGRLLSLVSTLGCVAALFQLASDTKRDEPDTHHMTRRPWVRWVCVLIFLTLPIVREWGVLVRVDMLGVCLGLWGIVALRRAMDVANSQRSDSLVQQRRWATVAGILLLLTLLTKPSLIAAPGAACLWCVYLEGRSLLFPARSSSKTRRVSLIVFGLLVLGGGLLFALLQWASNGWFALHVITANANRWDQTLAIGFWKQQLELRWPLLLAALLAMLWLLSEKQREGSGKTRWLPILYTLVALLPAVGVGKVGAYANYFLELYAGLIWLIDAAATSSTMGDEAQAQGQGQRVLWRYALAATLPLLLLASLLSYPPLWSATTLRQAGLLGPSPPRLAFGRYGLWADLRREAELLAAQARVQRALLREVARAGPTIFTDMPGVAAEAAVQARLQVFEHRQLLDQGEWDQQALLIELANGTLPLAVMDYLGNWLTPEMITLIQHRYAHDGSLGTFDLYRPVEPGPRLAADLAFADELYLTSYHLSEPGSVSPAGISGITAPVQAGNLLVVTLEWQRIGERDEHSQGEGEEQQKPSRLDVVLQLSDTNGQVLLESVQPLWYGALRPATLPLTLSVQHMQPLVLPPQLVPGPYHLAVTLRRDGRDLSRPQGLTDILVGTTAGQMFAETSYFVPAPLLRGWETLGGLEHVGSPVMPAVPFAWGTLQCFAYACLEMRDGGVFQRPLGEQLYLGETLRNDECLMENDAPLTLVCAAFREAGQNYGGDRSIGAAISGEISRYGYIVQWTRYARLERPLNGGGPVGLGRLGDDVQRLPPGMRYRWPVTDSP